MKTRKSGGFFRAIRLIVHDTLVSPLSKYLVYSTVLHALLIGGLSYGMFLPARPKAEPAKQDAVAGQPATTATSSDKPTGRDEDYYKHNGVDTTPAPRDELPKSPFDVKDGMK